MLRTHQPAVILAASTSWPASLLACVPLAVLPGGLSCSRSPSAACRPALFPCSRPPAGAGAAVAATFQLLVIDLTFLGLPDYSCSRPPAGAGPAAGAALGGAPAHLPARAALSNGIQVGLRLVMASGRLHVASQSYSGAARSLMPCASWR